MSSLFRARLLGAVACLVIGVAVQAAAQQTESRILGKVVDQSQAALPGVTVNATSKDTGAVRSTVTGGEGEFAITNLGPGAYTVEIELTGFQTRRRDVVLGVGQ